MTKWEYDYYKWNDIDKCISTDGGGFVVGKSLDEMGEEEWELVVIYNGVAHFKRPIVFDSEREPRTTTFEKFLKEYEKLLTLVAEQQND